LKKIALVLLLVLASPLPSESFRIEVMGRSLKVSASNEGVSSGWPLHSVTVETYKGPICFEILAWSEKGEVAAVNAVTRQSGPYLFFPYRNFPDDSCPRCSGFLVFKVAKRVEYLGYVTGNWEDLRALIPYKDGFFWDNYTALAESGACTMSPGMCPVFKIAKREKAGTLVVDPVGTWDANSDISKWVLNSKFRNRTEVLSYIALCKFLGREAEMDDGLRLAKEMSIDCACLKDVEFMDPGPSDNKIALKSGIVDPARCPLIPFSIPSSWNSIDRPVPQLAHPDR
jgi:hypothetical protein